MNRTNVEPPSASSSAGTMLPGRWVAPLMLGAATVTTFGALGLAAVYGEVETRLGVYKWSVCLYWDGQVVLRLLLEFLASSLSVGLGGLALGLVVGRIVLLDKRVP